EIAGIKGWFVSAAIVFAVVGLPLTFVGAPVDSRAWQTAVLLFAYVASNAHMFDVRDLESDIDSGVRTLPGRYGVARTKQLLILMNLCVLGAIFWGLDGGIALAHPEFVLSFVVAIIYIMILNVKIPRHVYDVLIDGSLYLPVLLIAYAHAAR
ncbi:MAG: hypothetical protein GXP62_06900, partial [Oligoflexia bacterium]|nr:hypothetical protein [Oligoflexia bacterium]